MRILIIKLGAKGDVVRTIPIAEAIKKKFPESEITWLTKQNASELLEGNPFIDKITNLPFNIDANFDIAYNFDTEKEATDILGKINAKKSYGFYSNQGYVSAFNIGAEYYLNTLFDDEIKKSNRKTYQEMMFEVAELEYNKEKPKIYLIEREEEYAYNFIKDNNLIGKKIIGIHMGSGPRWPSKAWAEEKIKEFIIKCKKEGYEVILFGGPDEVERLNKLFDRLEKEGISVLKNNPNNSNKEFCALVNCCNAVVCSDSFALHISLALGKKTIGLFFCTPSHEIEGYDLLTKIVSPKLYEFFPEKMNQYSKELVNSISSDEVFRAVKNLIF